ncbi:VRR-NUC domain-containing protein [Alteromonas sp. 5E99-2]|uniref:exonuclease domain-containing protein n=1 Tax=Alteromonas sp. 5E99-2 TaxID=2817683 RepID=UPI001A994577|nr:exonuclease domain-containing protein [Alteromonas sp. 5E99-2]MBO1256718.1 VRR-NUC domain-containing protein [Alteromonas sp. 5E99-2]
MKKTLPAFYYLAHFNEFLQFFEGTHKHLLSTEAKQFITQFKQTDKSLQALIVRIANRKHPVVALKTLYYEEIGDPAPLIEQLISIGWVSPLSQATPELLAEALPKSELLTLLKHQGATLPKSSIKKAALQRYFCEHVNIGEIHELIDMPFIVRQFDVPLQFLLFLYFGHMKGTLSQFSMRDLGVIKTRSDAVTGEPKFNSEDDAKNAFFYSKNTEFIDMKRKFALTNLDTLPEVTSAYGVNAKNTWLYKVGRSALDAQKEWALNALALSENDKAQELWIREQYKDGNKELVEKRLNEIIESGSSETLLVFAEDFYARKYQKKRTSTLTDMLRKATRCLPIDSRYNTQVEQGVVAYYSRKNIFAIRTENQLWRSLFGLCFWSVLYEQDCANLSNEFERAPPVLKQGTFYKTHSETIDRHLNSFKNNDDLFSFLLKNATKHYGKSNSIFKWRSHLVDRLKPLLQHASLSSILAQLKAMSQDYNALCDGYPDIMVIDNNQLRFEEIKAPGDSLRRNQLITIQKLQKLGFDVQITQVEWVRDPNQLYCVIDIETTGGKAEHHRITEIGIVKMQGNRVIDTWQTLVNPQRHIPSAITRLTGITNAMVADAPLFSDIADALDQYTENTLFVAHNVNFDLGFIKHEFARLHRHYRRPKLCTVQQCRQAFPGLASYSLANLTAHFDISMESHHRALSDAKAAAALLSLILEKETQ